MTYNLTDDLLCDIGAWRIACRCRLAEDGSSWSGEADRPVVGGGGGEAGGGTELRSNDTAKQP